MFFIYFFLFTFSKKNGTNFKNFSNDSSNCWISEIFLSIIFIHKTLPILYSFSFEFLILLKSGDSYRTTGLSSVAWGL
jgi:hypothetical protein